MGVGLQVSQDFQGPRPKARLRQPVAYPYPSLGRGLRRLNQQESALDQLAHHAEALRLYGFDRFVQA